MTLSHTEIDRIESTIGQRVVGSRAVHGGYTPARRLIVTLTDGSTLFAKIATNDLTAGWLRQEKRVYDSLNGPFLPRCLGWNDDGKHPILFLEDLSHAVWPPPWNDRRIAQVVETLREVARCRAPDLPKLSAYEQLTQGWRPVAVEPQPFLSLNLASESWLNRSLPTLLDIDCVAPLDGTDVVHLDIRSDNLCFDGDRVVIIDWNWACIGNAQFDFAAWSPSLEVEGGPRPESLLPDAGELACIVSGYFAANAGLPGVPDAPRLRRAQLTQLKSALPWTVRSLNLPPLDGTEARESSSRPRKDS